MNSNERNQFSEFEQQPYVDLTEWRSRLAAYTEARIEPVEYELRKYWRDLLPPMAHETAMNTVMSQLVRAYVEQIEPVVRPGDRIRVKGNIIYDIYTQSEHELEPEWLEQGSELWGRFQTITVKDYLDEEILDVDLSQLTEEFVGAHIRHYGAHLVLTDPIKIMPDGSEHDIPDSESLLIPLMYRRLNLTSYLEWNE